MEVYSVLCLSGKVQLLAQGVPRIRVPLDLMTWVHEYSRGRHILRSAISLLSWRHPKFEYLEAGTVEEACSLLSQYENKAKLIAGGTDLLVSMRRGKIAPLYVIDVKAIPNLDYITIIVV